MLSVLYTAIADELVTLGGFVVPLVGLEYVARNEPPPCMIFLEREDEFLPVEGPGGNPKPIFTVLEASDLIIRGATRDHVQGMRDQFVIAFRNAAKKANANGARASRIVLSKGTWTRNTIVARNGFEYRMVFSIAVPIVERTWDPSEAPIAASYEDGKADTYKRQPGSGVELDVDVGKRDSPPAADNVPIVINPQ